MEITDRIYAGLKQLFARREGFRTCIVEITDRIYAGLKHDPIALCLDLVSLWKLQTGFMRD